MPKPHPPSAGAAWPPVRPHVRSALNKIVQDLLVLKKVLIFVPN